MASQEKIDEILNDPGFTESEKWVVKWQFGFLGGFHSALANAIKLADERNLENLWRVFPDQVDGFRAWVYGDLSIRLRKAGLEI